MEEKIIEGKFSKTMIPLIICAVALLAIIICALIETNAIRNGLYDGNVNATLFEGLRNLYTFSTYYGIVRPIMFYFFVLVIIVSLVIFFMTRGCALTVSTTRVVGKSSFGRRVDLPLNQISAIGYGLFNSIGISTSSGRVQFWLLENREEVHKELSKLIANYQVKNTTTDSANEQTAPSTTNTVDELKKYKELLDAGVITQEEFEAKKKQLLEL